MKVQSFWEAFKQSLILQGILTILIWGVCCAMWLQGQTPPAPLLAAAGVVLGFYFTNKSEQQGARIANSSAQQLASHIGSLVETAQRQQLDTLPSINPPAVGDLPRN
jgi:hypothetical protein